MKSMHSITFWLLVIGGVNWLLVGIIGWDIGNLFGGQGAIISKIIYILVGLSALYEVFTHKNRCKECMMKGGSNMSSPGQPTQKM